LFPHRYEGHKDELATENTKVSKEKTKT
jgi:hypothetical protein